MLLFNDKRRYKTDDIRSCVYQYQSLFQGFPYDITYWPVKYKSLHQLDTSAFCDEIILINQFVKAICQIISDLVHMFYYMVLLK